MRCPFLSALALWLLLARALPAQPGRLVIVGGGLSDSTAAVYRAILDGRQGSGPFCVIPTASATPERAMDGPVRTFERYGGTGTARGVFIAATQPATAQDPAVVAQLRACSGFFFVGGVQSRVTAALRPDGRRTPALEAIWERWQAGAVVSGSSAGAAIMSDPMIAGGTSGGAFTRGLVRLEGPAADADSTAGMVLSRGLGFFPAALADQHFLARGRFGRLLVALLDAPGFDLAFGIDENTALVVDGPTVRAIGASGVIVFDARGAGRQGRGVRDLQLHLLGSEDTFDLTSRRLTAAAGKAPMATTGTPHRPVDNIFAPWAFLESLDAFARSEATVLPWIVPGGTITVRKSAAFRAVANSGTGPRGTAAGLGLTGLRVDVTRTADGSRP